MALIKQKAFQPINTFVSTTTLHKLILISCCVVFLASIYLLLMVGNDTSDKVGVGVSEGGHEFGELLLVQLANGTEHALACAGPEHRVHSCSCSHPHNLS